MDITNSTTQTSGNLVNITGTANQSALRVSQGNSNFDGDVSFNGEVSFHSEIILNNTIDIKTGEIKVETGTTVDDSGFIEFPKGHVGYNFAPLWSNRKCGYGCFKSIYVFTVR